MAFAMDRVPPTTTPNADDEVLTPNVTLYGNRAFKEVFKVK